MRTHGHRVLIAGADAAGVRLALELADAGLPVTLCTQGTLSPEAGGALGSSLYDEVPLLTALRNHPGDRGARGRPDRGDRAATATGWRRGCGCGRSRSTRRAAPPAANAFRSAPSTSRPRPGSRPTAP